MKKIFIALVLLLVSGSFAQAVGPEQNIFKIREGWNLINAQVVEDLDQDKNGFDELLRNGGALYGFNRIDKKYYGGGGERADIDANLEKMFRTLSDGDDGVHAMGWWLYSPREVDLSVDFDIHPDNIKDYQDSYHFNKGWNLVGISSVLFGKSIWEVKGSCAIEQAYHYELGNWRKQGDPELKLKMTQDSMGHALAIKVANDCVFNFSKTKITPPAIPN